MRKMLVTGAGGLVGSEAVKFFSAKEWEVIGIDNNNRANFFGTPEKKGFVDVDITDVGMLTWLFIEHKFDAIIHAAAQPSHDYSTAHILEDFLINALGTVLLLESARKYCPKATFIHVSTDKVYGENMKVPIGETEKRYKAEYDGVNNNLHKKGFDEFIGLDFAGHRSFFGCSKTAADIYAQEYANEFGMKVGIFRPGCITGKNHEGAELHGFLAYLTKCIKNGTTYKIFGDGKTVRDQIHAHDLITAFDEFLKSPKAGAVYNIGGGLERSTSILEAIQLIEEATGKKAITEFHEEREGDRKWDVHDVSKFKKDYPNWKYEYSLSDIIKDICSH